MATVVKTWTVEDLLAMPDNGLRHELVRGELIEMPPPGEEHGEIAANIAALLRGPIKLAGRGRVLVESGAVISRDPATVFGPDVSVMLGGTDVRPARGYAERLPALVFEVVSPSDSAAAVHDKLETYLEAGVTIVVAVWPDRRQLTVGTQAERWRVLSAQDVLDLGEIVPDLTLSIAEIFA